MAPGIFLHEHFSTRYFGREYYSEIFYSASYISAQQTLCKPMHVESMIDILVHDGRPNSFSDFSRKGGFLLAWVCMSPGQEIREQREDVLEMHRTCVVRMESIGLDGAPSPRGQQDDTNARRREEGMRWLALARVKEAIKNMQLYCLNSIVKKK